MIQLEPAAAEAIQSFLAENRIQNRVVRIDLRGTGCCDPSLMLVVDEVDQSDHILEIQGLTMVIHPRICALTGVVTVRLAAGPGKNEFILSAQHPLGEWEGFAASSIQIEKKPV
jgi:uncharacterized protein YqkB